MSEILPLSIRASLLAQKLEAKLYRLSFERFCKAAWRQVEGGRELRWNWHMSVICHECQDFIEGRTDADVLIINVPPRATKSTLVSVMLPAWIWTWNASHQMLALSHVDGVVLRDALKHRRLVQSQWYQTRFNVYLRKDQQAKGNFETTQGGTRISQSIGAGMTGKGGDVVLIDDPHDAEAMTDNARQAVLDAYDHRIVTRSNEPGDVKIILIMQRLHEMDLAGHIQANEGRVRTVCLPMQYEPDHPAVYDGDPRTEEGELLDKRRFPKPAVERLTKLLGKDQAPGQLQQRPTRRGGNIILTEWWQPWPEDLPKPQPVYRLIAWDTAYTDKDEMPSGKKNAKRRSYSACSVWDVFYNSRTGKNNFCLVWGWRDQVGLPGLLKRFRAVEDKFEPDTHIVELKASGKSVVQVLKKRNVPILRYTPVADKVSRAYSTQLVFEEGFIWFLNKPVCHQIIDEVARFPKAETDDWTDTVTCAVKRFEQMYMSYDDEPDDDEIIDGYRPSARRRQQRRIAVYG